MYHRIDHMFGRVTGDNIDVSGVGEDQALLELALDAAKECLTASGWSQDVAFAPGSNHRHMNVVKVRRIVYELVGANVDLTSC